MRLNLSEADDPTLFLIGSFISRDAGGKNLDFEAGAGVPLAKGGGCLFIKKGCRGILGLVWGFGWVGGLGVCGMGG